MLVCYLFPKIVHSILQCCPVCMPSCQSIPVLGLFPLLTSSSQKSPSRISNSLGLCKQVQITTSKGGKLLISRKRFLRRESHKTGMLWACRHATMQNGINHLDIDYRKAEHTADCELHNQFYSVHPEAAVECNSLHMLLSSHKKATKGGKLLCAPPGSLLSSAVSNLSLPCRMAFLPLAYQVATAAAG